MPSKKLQMYIEADRREKEAAKDKEKVKGYVSRLLQRCKSLGVSLKGVSFSQSERFEFLEDELYEWVKTQVTPEILESMTKRTIDLEKLHEANLEGIINSVEMPSSCYKIVSYNTIRISHK